MAKYQGSVAVTGFISPTDTSDTYATHDSALGRGGLREVLSLQDRDDIPDDRRREGMIVFVDETEHYYMLSGDITNLSWKDLGTQLGGFEELSALIKDLQEEVDDLTVEVDKLKKRTPTYMMSVSLTSTMETDELLYIAVLPYDLNPAETGSCIATAQVIDDAVLLIKLDDEEIGTIEFIDGLEGGRINFSADAALNKNSILTIHAPISVSALADVALHLSFTIRESI